MSENVTIVFHGFLNLTTKEKMQMVEAINNYFDSNNREPIRAENEHQFGEINISKTKCACCNR
jgi:hypothetical protein